MDLINSFCIRNGDETVMDPACGGGTFLVRAYARKRELDPARKHGDLLCDLFGVDVSHFATHLTTINLATGHLIEEENYPQIARKDFFDIKVHNTFVSLPKRVKTKGLGAIQHRKIKIPPLDAVVGNPPYLRQEDIPKAKKKAKGRLEQRTKEYYRQIVSQEAKADLSGRSDIHCYFWPHATTFLKDDGYLCFLTSSQWLDVEYGFRLQEWILWDFEIVAVFESIDEPWFVGARVATAVTILHRQQDEAGRMKNLVRFVQLRRPMSEILAHNGTTAGAVEAVDAFRDEILRLNHNTDNERYRARLVRQGKLWKDGVRLSVMMGRSKNVGSEDPDVQDGEYYGGKWGVYLRAPDLWFELLDNCGSRLVPLGDIADVWRGITSGKDCFFFPKDCSMDCLNAYRDPVQFEFHYGVPRKDVKSGKVKLVLCGQGLGEVRPIEAKYLEPELHSIMEVQAYSITAKECSREVLLVGKKRSQIKDSYILDYIRWGEQNGYHKGSTCAARVTQEREWYDLTGHKRGQLFWPMAQQYKHTIATNDDNIVCNHRLFDISLRDVRPAIMGGILNSSWVLLSKYQYGRPVGVEGHLDTEVIDVKMMLVPDSTNASKRSQQRLAKAFGKLKDRNALQFLSEHRMRQMAYTEAGKEDQLEKLSDLSELDMADRRELDDAVLELLGVSSKKRREELLEELYTYLREFFEWTRQKEEKAIANKKKAKRRRRASPSEIAFQIYEEIKDKESHFLRQYDPDFIDRSKPYDTFEFPAEGVAKEDRSLFNQHGVSFMKRKKTIGVVDTKIPAQDKLVVLVANSGVRGLVRIPHEEKECRRVLRTYGEFVRDREQRIRELIEQRTADEDMQEKIHEALMPLILHKA